MINSQNKIPDQRFDKALENDIKNKATKASFSQKYLRNSIKLTPEENNIKQSVIDAFKNIKTLEMKIEAFKENLEKQDLNPRQRKDIESDLTNTLMELDNQKVSIEGVRKQLKGKKILLAMKNDKGLKFKESKEFRTLIARIDYQKNRLLFLNRTQDDVQNSINHIKNSIKSIGLGLKINESNDNDDSVLKSYQHILLKNKRDLGMIKNTIETSTLSKEEKNDLLNQISTSIKEIKNNLTPDNILKDHIKECEIEIRKWDSEPFTFQTLMRIVDLKIDIIETNNKLGKNEIKYSPESINNLINKKESLKKIHLAISEIELNLKGNNRGELKANKNKLESALAEINSISLDEGKIPVLSKNEKEFYLAEKIKIKNLIQVNDYKVEKENKLLTGFNEIKKKLDVTRPLLEQVTVLIELEHKFESLRNFKITSYDPTNWNDGTVLSRSIEDFIKLRKKFFNSTELEKIASYNQLYIPTDITIEDFMKQLHSKGININSVLKSEKKPQSNKTSQKLTEADETLTKPKNEKELKAIAKKEEELKAVFRDILPGIRATSINEFFKKGENERIKIINEAVERALEVYENNKINDGKVAHLMTVLCTNDFIKYVKPELLSPSILEMYFGPNDISKFSREQVFYFVSEDTMDYKTEFKSQFKEDFLLREARKYES
jgi:hypothetical protein